MLATTATLSPDLSLFTKVPVTFRKPDSSVGFSSTANVGQFSWSRMTGDAAAVGLPADFTSFCIEGLQRISPGRNAFPTLVSALPSTPPSGAPPIADIRAGILAEFWGQYGPATAAGFADQTDAAAFQLAVWEIVGDAVRAGSSGPAANRISFDLTAGQFSVNRAGRSQPAFLRAQQWLAGFDAGAPAKNPVALYVLQNPTKQDQVVCVPTVDLDVDSDNDDRLDTPKRNIDEEIKEPTTPKRLVVNDNDTDGDDVPDYADWTIAGKRFTPLVIQIPAGQPLEGMQLNVSYKASDPGLVGPDHRLPANSAERPLRIWTKNASDDRNTASVTAGGHFVPEGKILDLTELGFTDAKRTVELYVEGVATTAGVSQPISIELTVGGRASPPDLVNVVVVSNTLVIGIDGTGSEAWLAKEVDKVRINERNTPDGTRWNSHVRNVVADSWPFAITIYQPGPPSNDGRESDDIFRAVRDAAEGIIQDAGGGTSIALVGWSRGAMIASGVANALANTPAGGLPRNVVFVGMYDPVDMSPQVDDAWARISRNVEAVTIVGPTGPRSADGDAPHNNVDYDHFIRMANRDILGRWQITHRGTVIIDRRTYNASHGSIGGTPGYNDRNREPPRGVYDYAEDRSNSILSDQDIRAAMRRAGMDFVPDRNAAWYGFPSTRPPEDHWE